ncbi:MAG: hypothetical protein ACE5IL_03325 [Myxococcota bacterium]
MEVDPQAILTGLGRARRFADPTAPLEARLMAARGALPLPPAEVALVVFALTFDPEAEVKERALETLRTLPDPIVDALVGEALHPGLLALLAEIHREHAGRLERIALNPATSDETLCFLATLPHPNVVDAISHNQARLVACDALLESLGENPLTGAATIERILEFLGRERGEIPAAPVSETAAEDPAADPESEAAAALPEVLLTESEPPLHESERDERSRNLQSLIAEMSVVEKVKLARLGNAEARGLLVRDRNRIVATAAIRSPKLSENEVTHYAKSRNVSDDVLRILAHSREWTRSYPVKLALCTNPKTPIPAAIKFINYLTDRDLKAIMKSRDVPGPVSQQARRILMRKGKI